MVMMLAFFKSGGTESEFQILVRSSIRRDFTAGPALLSSSKGTLSGPGALPDFIRFIALVSSSEVGGSDIQCWMGAWGEL